MDKKEEKEKKKPSSLSFLTWSPKLKIIINLKKKKNIKGAII